MASNTQECPVVPQTFVEEINYNEIEELTVNKNLVTLYSIVFDIVLLFSVL